MKNTNARKVLLALGLGLGLGLSSVAATAGSQCSTWLAECEGNSPYWLQSCNKYMAMCGDIP